jgi:hypothetical protein
VSPLVSLWFRRYASHRTHLVLPHSADSGPTLRRCSPASGPFVPRLAGVMMS